MRLHHSRSHPALTGDPLGRRPDAARTPDGRSRGRDLAVCPPRPADSASGACPHQNQDGALCQRRGPFTRAATLQHCMARWWRSSAGHGGLVVRWSNIGQAGRALVGCWWCGGQTQFSRGAPKGRAWGVRAPLGTSKTLYFQRFFR